MLVRSALRGVSYSSWGEKSPPKKQTASCKEQVLYDKRFMSIGEVDNPIQVPTVRIKEPEY